MRRGLKDSLLALDDPLDAEVARCSPGLAPV